MLAQLAVAAQQFLFERDAAMLEADAQFGAALGEFGVELAFEGADLLDQHGNLRGHVRRSLGGTVAETRIAPPA